jgi:hypothetical protein
MLLPGVMVVAVMVVATPVGAPVSVSDNGPLNTPSGELQLTVVLADAPAVTTNEEAEDG